MPNDLRLNLLPINEYIGVNRDDPIRWYSWPIIGPLYRRRVEMCLEQCAGGQRVVEIGYGSGVTFLNLARMYQEICGLDLAADARQIQQMFLSRRIHTELRNGSVLDMPYPDNQFDTVLLISILEHLKPAELDVAFAEIRRVLKPGGQVVYGVPVERRLMVLAFRVMGYNIREHHFSTHDDVSSAAGRALRRVRIKSLKGLGGLVGSVYEVGHFIKPAEGEAAVTPALTTSAHPAPAPCK